jgi:hypothetical protein
MTTRTTTRSRGWMVRIAVAASRDQSQPKPADSPILAPRPCVVGSNGYSDHRKERPSVTQTTTKRSSRLPNGLLRSG